MNFHCGKSGSINRFYIFFKIFERKNCKLYFRKNRACGSHIFNGAWCTDTCYKLKICYCFCLWHQFRLCINWITIANWICQFRREVWIWNSWSFADMLGHSRSFRVELTKIHIKIASENPFSVDNCFKWVDFNFEIAIEFKFIICTSKFYQK